MAKRSGWYSKSRKGSVTTTVNTVKGTTRTWSIGKRGGERIATSVLPNGSVRTRQTVRCGNQTRVIQRTRSGLGRSRSRSGRYGDAVGLIVLVVILLISLFGGQ